MENIYYILTKEQLSVCSSDEIVESKETARSNNDKTKFIIKTKVGVNECDDLKGITPYTHAEIKTEIKKAEWINNDE